jgi:hypothetical protein
MGLAPSTLRGGIPTMLSDATYDGGITLSTRFGLPDRGEQLERAG